MPKSKSSRKNRRALKSGAARRLRRKRRIASRRNRTVPAAKPPSPRGTSSPARPPVPAPLPDGFQVAGQYLSEAADNLGCELSDDLDDIERWWGALALYLDAEPEVTVDQLFHHLPGALAITLQHSVCERLQEAIFDNARARQVLRTVCQGWLDRFAGQEPSFDTMMRRSLSDAIELSDGPTAALEFVGDWMAKEPNCPTAVVCLALIDVTGNRDADTQRALAILQKALAEATDTEAAATLYTGIGSALQKAGRHRESSAFNMRSHEVWCDRVYHGQVDYNEAVAARMAQRWPLPDASTLEDIVA